MACAYPLILVLRLEKTELGLENELLTVISNHCIE